MVSLYFVHFGESKRRVHIIICPTRLLCASTPHNLTTFYISTLLVEFGGGSVVLLQPRSSNPSRDRPQPLTQIVTVLLPNTRQQVSMPRIVRMRSNNLRSQKVWHAKEPEPRIMKDLRLESKVQLLINLFCHKWITEIHENEMAWRHV